MDPLTLLLWLLVVVLIIGLIWWVGNAMGLPQPVMIAIMVLVVIVILFSFVRGGRITAFG